MSRHVEDVLVHRGCFSVKMRQREVAFLGSPKGSSLVGGRSLEYLRIDFLSDGDKPKGPFPGWLSQESFPNLTTLSVGQRQLSRLEELKKRFPKVEVLEVTVFGEVLLLKRSPFPKMVFVGRPLKHPHVSVTINSPLDYLEVYGAAAEVDLHLWVCPRELKLGSRVHLRGTPSLGEVESLSLGCGNLLDDFSELKSLKEFHVRRYIGEEDPSSLRLPKHLKILGVDTKDPLEVTLPGVDHLLLGRKSGLWKEPLLDEEIDFSPWLTLSCVPKEITGQCALLRRGNVVVLPRESTFLVELPSPCPNALDWLDQNTVCYQTNIPDVYQVTSGRILSLGKWILQ